LKKNNGHWGLSIAYILQVVLQPSEWNENLKDIQDKWDMNKKNPYDLNFFFRSLIYNFENCANVNSRLKITWKD
jgi:hypothetical protein